MRLLSLAWGLAMKHTLKRSTAGASLLGVVAINPLWAKDETGDLVQLGYITGTGTGVQTREINQPAAISLGGGRENGYNLQGLIASLSPDVPVVKGTKSDLSSIRGKAAQRAAIPIDRQSLYDHTPCGAPIQISPIEIKQIETVKGQYSDVSGNRVIAATVNVTAKRETDKTNEYSATAGYIGFRAQNYDASTAGLVGDECSRIDLAKRGLPKINAFYEREDLTPCMSMTSQPSMATQI